MIKLLLVYDVEDWAWYNEMLALSWYLHRLAPGAFAPTLARCGVYRGDPLLAFDLVCSCVYYHLVEAEHPRAISQISSDSYWIRKGWTAQENTETGVAGWPHLRRWRWMVAKNSDLYGRLTLQDHPEVTRLYHLLDPERWTPAGSARPHGRFRVGFAGHSNMASKGLPLIAAAAEAVGAELSAPTWESGRLSPERMPDWYRSLDAYVCFSTPGQEGGPLPPMEAGLCGVPVVTTRVGQIGEMVEDGVNGLVVERSHEALVDALRRLQGDVELRGTLGRNARDSFAEWADDTGRAWVNYLLERAP